MERNEMELVKHTPSKTNSSMEFDEDDQEEERLETISGTLETFEEEKIDTVQPTYLIRPELYDKFRTLSAKEIIHDVLFDQLSTKTYDVHDATHWIKDIADAIKFRIKGYDILRSYRVCSILLLKVDDGKVVKKGISEIWKREKS